MIVPVRGQQPGQQPRRQRGRQRGRQEVAVAAGGALGALARHGLTNALPYGTLVINASGSFALGVLVAVVVRRWPDDRTRRHFAATGFLGGYTTFSTFMVDAVQRNPAYLVAGLLTGLGAAWLGVAAGRVLAR
jgi:CrcB protein